MSPTRYYPNSLDKLDILSQADTCTAVGQIGTCCGEAPDHVQTPRAFPKNLVSLTWPVK